MGSYDGVLIGLLLIAAILLVGGLICLPIVRRMPSIRDWVVDYLLKHNDKESVFRDVQNPEVKSVPPRPGNQKPTPPSVSPKRGITLPPRPVPKEKKDN